MRTSAKKKKVEAEGLSKADEYYLEQHRDDTPERLAAELKKPVELVESFLAGLPAPKKQTLFAEDKGTIQMTQGQSERDDKDAGKSKGVLPPFSRWKDCIHKQDPDLPCT